MRRVLLLGGGHAHVHVLAALAEAPLPGAEVTLLTPSPHALYSGMVPGLVAGHYKPDQCSIALAPLAARARVRLVQGAATALDAAARIVHAGDTEHRYDVLAIDTGSTAPRDAIPGAAEHGVFVRPIQRFVALWQQVAELAAQRPLGIVVIGGGAAGVELALAMQHRLGAQARLSLVTGGVAPLDGYPAAVQRHALAALRRHAITAFVDRCTAIAADHVLLAGGARLQCDAPVIALGAAAPAWLCGSGLALDAQGFVATGATLQSTSHPEVFAAGDVASRADAPHPKSGVYAVRAGPPLALNLRRFVAGGTLEVYRPQARSLNLVSLGERRAIASWGGFSAEGRWAWWWKDRIDRAFIARFAGAALATRAP